MAVLSALEMGVIIAVTGISPEILGALCLRFIMKGEPTIPKEDESNSNICIWESRRPIKGRLEVSRQPVRADSSDEQEGDPV
jgi:hypothetical protein